MNTDVKSEMNVAIDNEWATLDTATKDQGSGVMSVKITDHNTIAIGERYENGAFKREYEFYSDQVNTEQKVLACVYDLCTKGDGIDKGIIQLFITCCGAMHPTLNLTKD